MWVWSGSVGSGVLYVRCAPFGVVLALREEMAGELEGKVAMLEGKNRELQENHDKLVESYGKLETTVNEYSAECTTLLKVCQFTVFSPSLPLSFNCPTLWPHPPRILRTSQKRTSRYVTIGTTYIRRSIISWDNSQHEMRRLTGYVVRGAWQSLWGCQSN